jgi:hypothetical protein
VQVRLRVAVAPVLAVFVNVDVYLVRRVEPAYSLSPQRRSVEVARLGYDESFNVRGYEWKR